MGSRLNELGDVAGSMLLGRGWDLRHGATIPSPEAADREIASVSQTEIDDFLTELDTSQSVTLGGLMHFSNKDQEII